MMHVAILHHHTQPPLLIYVAMADTAISCNFQTMLASNPFPLLCVHSLCTLRCHLSACPVCCVLYLQGWWSEQDWAQLEEAASCAQVVKVEVNVGDEFSASLDDSAGASRALAAGFSKNPLLREVELWDVPEELVESVRGTLCTNTALAVNVSD